MNGTYSGETGVKVGRVAVLELGIELVDADGRPLRPGRRLEALEERETACRRRRRRGHFARRRRAAVLVEHLSLIHI